MSTDLPDVYEVNPIPIKRQRVSIFKADSSDGVLIRLEPNWLLKDLVDRASGYLSINSEDFSLALRRNRAKIYSLGELRDEDDLIFVNKPKIKVKGEEEVAEKEIKELNKKPIEVKRGITKVERTREKRKSKSKSEPNDAQKAAKKIKSPKYLQASLNITRSEKTENGNESDINSLSPILRPIYNYFFDCEPRAHPGKVATFMVLAQNVMPMTVSQIISEATEDGYLLETDAKAWDMVNGIKEDMERKNSYFRIRDDGKIGLSEHGQDTVDDIKDLKELIRMLARFNYYSTSDKSDSSADDKKDGKKDGKKR